MKLTHHCRAALLLPLAAAFLALTLNGARAQLTVDITQGQIEPLPIAVPEFIAASPEAAQFAQDITRVVVNDLESSGLFRAVDPRAFLSTPTSVNVTPNFNNWRVLNAEALLIGQVDLLPDGNLRTQFRLWDVFAQTPLEGLRLSIGPDGWRRLGHKVADTVYERITGERGYFDTRVVYISETGPADQRVKRLAIMDQDGADHEFLTDGETLILTPRFSASSQEITYLAYFNDQPRVYLYNIDTREQEVLGDFSGMTFAPRFSPDGEKVIMSFAEDGNTDIYSMDLRTRAVQRLTTNPGIDTSPSYAPDGDRIVFESDRSGTQQLYTMRADGSDVSRITFSAGRYGTPVWSPREDLIAFTKIHQGQFHIGVMRPDGSAERLLTNGFVVEGPTWAVNGRVLMYTRQTASDAAGAGGSSRLFSIDLTGNNEREVTTPLDGSDPAWSPLLR